MNAAYYGVLPPALLDGLEWKLSVYGLPDESFSHERLISEVSDAHLVQYLCSSLAGFSCTADGSHYRQVECLVH
jgi:hypothetical protein